MSETMSSIDFWLGVTLLNTFFLFRTFIKNIILSKRLESTIVKLTDKNKEIMEIESILGNKITSLMEELKELKNS